jgi:Fe2+-dicitrate sensor, membrane component
MQDLIYINIAKQLNGEATEAEQQQVEAWLAESPDNVSVYNDLKAAWQASDELFDTPAFNSNTAWANVASRIQVDAAPKKRSIALPAWAKYTLAAAAILLVGLFVVKQNGNDTITIAANEGNMEITLPDNSHITLKKGSVLQYPEKFEATQRKVALQGEAFFEVARNEKSPFIINAQSAEVKVLGTSFNVKCDKEKASVVVRTGKVQMSVAKASVILTPGEKGSLVNGRLSEENVSIDNYMYWRTGTLNFSNTQLSSVISELSELKDTTIMFDSAFTEAQKAQLISISFHNQSLDEMMADIGLITQSQWLKKDSVFILSNK